MEIDNKWSSYMYISLGEPSLATSANCYIWAGYSDNETNYALTSLRIVYCEEILLLNNSD